MGKPGQKERLTFAPWPQFDPELAREEGIKIVIQVNGKGSLQVFCPAGNFQRGNGDPGPGRRKTKAFIEGKPIRKVIVVPQKLVNIVV